MFGSNSSCIQYYPKIKVTLHCILMGPTNMGVTTIFKLVKMFWLLEWERLVELIQRVNWIYSRKFLWNWWISWVGGNWFSKKYFLQHKKFDIRHMCGTKEIQETFYKINERILSILSGTGTIYHMLKKNPPDTWVNSFLSPMV